MKILFQSRVDLFDLIGGDTMQIEHTKKYIEKLFPDVSIDISTNLKEKNISNYDIVHLFNLDWISETYIQAKWAKKHKKPLVISAIHHSEEEVKRYEKYYRFDLRRIVNIFFPTQSLRDELKNVYRSIFNFKKIHPTAIQILRGIRNTQRDVLKLADIVLVQTEIEAEDIQKDFDYKIFKWKKVVNGVNSEVFLKPDKKLFKSSVKLNHNQKIILNVGRIEPRKNQLKLIEAYEALKKSNDKFEDFVLVFIGSINKYHFEYYTRFLNKVKKDKNILYIGPKPQVFVASAMANSYLYVQPSWFETTGLVTLEAYISGMKIVASGERITEYLSDNVVICDPASTASITDAIIKADGMSYDKKLVDYAIKNYTWEKTAKQTMNVYRSLLR